MNFKVMRLYLGAVSVQNIGWQSEMWVTGRFFQRWVLMWW